MSRFSASPIVAVFARGVAEQEVNLLHDKALDEVFESGLVHQEEKQNQENEDQKEEDDDEDAVVRAPRKGKLQQVVSIGSRREVVRWMEQEFSRCHRTMAYPAINAAVASDHSGTSQPL
jgi:hypothetical protein